jgi:hypothetical protein
VSQLRQELAAVVDALLVASEDTRSVTLDEIGDAIGTKSVSTDEIELVFRTLEARGRTITGPEGGGGEERLRKVVASARSLSASQGRRATVAEIAADAGLTEIEVRHALALARVMQR